MNVFGLTGGVGMGKSTAAKILSRRGIPVVDTDELARQAVQPGAPALAEIQTAFGREVIAADGTLRRDQLARIVFADAAQRQRLEAILHPRIRELWQAQLARWQAEGRATAVVVIPLLFETGAQAQFHKIICVACSAATQQRRLTDRGWTAEQIAGRIAAQLPTTTKMELAHHVVWSEGSEAALADQLARLIP